MWLLKKRTVVILTRQYKPSILLREDYTPLKEQSSKLSTKKKAVSVKLESGATSLFSDIF